MDAKKSQWSKALVTGGGGFIGSHLVDRLLIEDTETVVIDDFSNGEYSNINAGSHIIIKDIAEPLNFQQYLRPDVSKNIDIIYHLAAKLELNPANPNESRKTNVDGTLNILDFAVKNNIQNVVVASSAAVYSFDNTCVTLNPTSPTSFYGADKATVENYCAVYTARYGLNISCIRFFNVYGPRQKGGVVMNFINRLLNNLPINIDNTGEQTRDFIYVDDVVHALLNEKPKNFNIYNLGTGKDITINYLYKEISRLCKMHQFPNHLINNRSGTRFSRAGRMNLCQYPTTPLEDGLRKTIAYVYSKVGRSLPYVPSETT